MDGFASSGFVREHTLEFVPQGSAVLGIVGEVSCRGDMMVRVEKYLDVLENDSPDPLVQTFSYSYNASVRGASNVLRYDNWHAHEGHPDEHHGHRMNWETGDELTGSPFWVGVTGWPTLSQFFEELERWYWEHREELPNPDGYGALGLRG